MEMALPLAAEKVSVPSSFMVWAAGTVFTGASLTALTVMATVSMSVWAPPEPVLPWSLVVTVRLADAVEVAGRREHQAVEGGVDVGEACR